MTDAARGKPALGFVGLGAMGGAMAGKLLKAGYPLVCFDVNRERIALCAAEGAVAAESVEGAGEECDFVLTSLPSSEVFVEVAGGSLLPRARAGQVFVDLGTTTPPDTRRLAAAFEAKGAALVDAPVSGGPEGARRGNLHIFVGGPPSVVERCMPILRVLGDEERIVCCGPSGCGQVVKGVNQLAMGLGAAAYLEAAAFGVLAGVSAEALLRAVGGDESWRKHFASIAGQVARGKGEQILVKFPELPYFLQEAEAKGIRLPLTEALYSFCKSGERKFRDNMNRATVSYWHELLTRGSAKGE